MNLHRLRLSAWSERMYLKYNRPHCTFLGTSLVLGPRSAQKRYFEALLDRFLPDPSADARTPQNGVLSALFAPRSLQEGQRDRETKHALHSHKAITFGMLDGSPVHRKERGALGSHFHGVGGHPTTALQMALFGAPRCPNSRSKPKPRHLIGTAVRKFWCKIFFILQGWTAPDF